MRTLRSLGAPGLLTALLAACSPPATPADAGDAPATDAADVPDDIAADVPQNTCTPAWLAEPFDPTPRGRFPERFLWGSATAPYQIEGGLEHTDWGEWERRGRVVNGDRASDGPQSLTHYTQDIRVLTETSQNAYRFGIEWARLFPTRSAWDACRTAPAATRYVQCRAAASADGLAYYHRVLDALRAASITPMVTVQHFSLPGYISDLSMDFTTQGWMREDIVQDLGVYAGFVAAEYGAKVDWWVTINEPLVVAAVGYIDGRMPPGQSGQFDAVLRVAQNMIRAHAAAYDAIHANDTTVAQATGPVTPARAAMVSISHHVRRFVPNDCRDRRDQTAADRADYLFNRLFLEAIVRGNLDADGSGTLEPGEPMNDPSLRGRADYLGINYYSLTTVANSSVIPLLRGLPQPDERERGLPKTEFGWDIYPRGFLDLLTWAGGYNLPIVVTENGLADSTGANRGRFLAEHLAAVAAAIARGANIVGYFHWSTIDNFEWVAGYCPRFGLYSVDYASPMRTRRARPGADVYRAIITAGEVTDALLAAQPPYQSATRFCSTLPTEHDGGR